MIGIVYFVKKQTSSEDQNVAKLIIKHFEEEEGCVHLMRPELNE